MLSSQRALLVPGIKKKKKKKKKGIADVRPKIIGSVMSGEIERVFEENKIESQ